MRLAIIPFFLLASLTGFTAQRLGAAETGSPSREETVEFIRAKLLASKKVSGNSTEKTISVDYKAPILTVVQHLSSVLPSGYVTSTTNKRKFNLEKVTSVTLSGSDKKDVRIKGPDCLHYEIGEGKSQGVSSNASLELDTADAAERVARAIEYLVSRTKAPKELF